MAKGQSGRIVVEVDPALKRALYGALAVDESTLKEWFIEQAKKYLNKKQAKAGVKAKKQ